MKINVLFQQVKKKNLYLDENVRSLFKKGNDEQILVHDIEKQRQ